MQNYWPAGLTITKFILTYARSLKTKLRISKILSREKNKLANVQAKKVVRVAFVISHYSTWKTGYLYQLLAADSKFSPCIIVAPDIANDISWSDAEASRAYDYFENSNYDVYLGFRDDDSNASLVKKVAPEIVFFNNPHHLISDALYFALIERCLACYIPYHVEVCKYDENQSQYNQSFHNAVWKIFAPHEISLETYKCTQNRKAENVIVTGYPGLEMLINKSPEIILKREKKKIIWAPHHTVKMPSLPYSNFLRYSDFFLLLAEEYSESVDWIFKPHPLLKTRLIEHENWGKKSTEEYYSIWRNGSNTRLEIDGYAELFKESDAMIHDSGSFLAEYIYVDKPVMYLWSSPNLLNFFNDFGLSALSACDRGDNESDIRRFVEDVLADRDPMKNERQRFIENNPVIIDDTTPSERIMHELKSALNARLT